MEDPIDLIFAAFDPNGAGSTKIATLTGWPVSTIHSWKGGNIPRWRRADLVELANEHGVELPPAAMQYLDPDGKTRRRISNAAEPGYPDSPGHQKTDTSRAAAESMKAQAPTLQSRVLSAIFMAGEAGLTTNEVAAALNIPRDSIQPRTSELRAMRKIKDSGLRRKNANGKSAIVWVTLKGAQ